MDDAELDQLAEEGLLLKYIGLRPAQPVGELTYLAGGGVDEVSVTLRFFGRDLDPDQLTEMFGCQPTTARRKGDRLRDRWIATTGVWFLHQRRTTMTLASYIETLFERLPHDLSLWDSLRRFNGELSCSGWCRTWNRALALPAPLLNDIAARHLSLTFDMYFEPDEEDESET